ARDHVADGDLLARLGIGHQQGLGLPVMQVEDLGQCVRRAVELGMIDDIAHALAVDPDRAWPAQALQELLTRPCRHSPSPAFVGPVKLYPPWTTRPCAGYRQVTVRRIESDG